MNRPTKPMRARRSERSHSDQRMSAMQTIDLMSLYSVMRANIRIIIGVTTACIVAMFVYLQFVPPIYTAYSQLILDTREQRATPVEEVVSNLDVTSSVIAGEVLTIRSKVLVGRVVDKLKLVDVPELDPRVPKSEALFSKFKRILRRGEPVHVIASRLPDDILRSWVVDAVRKQLSVSQIGVSYAIGVSFDHTNPVLAAEIANAVADEYIDSQLDNKMAATMRANQWLSDRLDEMGVQVQEADAAVVDFKSEMIDIAGGNEDSINQLLAELNTKLVGSSTERADAEVRLSQVTMLKDSGGWEAVADVVTSPLLETLQRQKSELAAQQAQLASTLGRKHPEMIRISAQIADVNRSIEGELNRRLEEMRSTVIVTKNREEALRQQIAVVSERADSLSKASVRLDQLQRTAQAARLVYENFLSRYKETSAQADFQTPEAWVIGRADVPVVPSGPRKTLFMLTAMVFGFSLAIALVFLRNFIRAPITTPEELNALTHRPNLALLPYVPHLGNKYGWLRNILEGEVGSQYMERVRTIRASLLDAPPGERRKVIMVTSSAPAEGKSSLCCALAKSMSGPRSSVLLLDADLRRPDLRKALHLPSEGACLVAYLEQREKLKDLVMRSDLLGVDVISASVPSENAADLLSSVQFSGLITRMESRYDAIILNAPPVLHMADAMLLTKHADATLFAVRSSSTPAKVVLSSYERLEDAGANVVGTVITMVRRKDAAAREIGMYSYDY